MKVLMFDFRPSEEEFFKQNIFPDLEIKFYNESLTEKTKLSQNELKETDVISVYNSSLLTQNILSKFKNIRTIVTRSAEYNHIDTEYCAKHRIAVFNVNEHNENAVAEYTFGLLINLLRGINSAVYDTKYNKIHPYKYEGKLLGSLTIGIIGCKKAGLRIAEISNFFGMKILVSSCNANMFDNKYCSIVSLEDLIENSDIIVLNMQCSAETFQMLGEQEFEKMKNGVIIINTLSIDLIDMTSLYKYLKNGKIKGVGLDIISSNYIKSKPQNSEEKEILKTINKLFDMPNVILTPHISSNIDTSIETILRKTIYNIRDCSKGLYTENRIC